MGTDTPGRATPASHTIHSWRRSHSFDFCRELAPNTEYKLELYVMEGDQPQALVSAVNFSTGGIDYRYQIYLIRAPNTTRDLAAALSLLMSGSGRAGELERGGVFPHIPRRPHSQDLA